MSTLVKDLKGHLEVIDRLIREEDDEILKMRQKLKDAEEWSKKKKLLYNEIVELMERKTENVSSSSEDEDVKDISLSLVADPPKLSPTPLKRYAIKDFTGELNAVFELAGILDADGYKDEAAGMHLHVIHESDEKKAVAEIYCDSCLWLGQYYLEKQKWTLATNYAKRCVKNEKTSTAGAAMLKQIEDTSGITDFSGSDASSNDD